jgi:hypothetical protein
MECNQAFHKVLLVRHSERIDEVDLDAWFQIVASHKGRRNRHEYDHHNDPILTERGHGIAAAAGCTLHKAISRVVESGDSAHSKSIENSFLDDLKSLKKTGAIPIRCLYASRLRRAIETAHRIALELKVPIFVSSGLAMTAKAVEEKTGGNFQFHTLEEIRAFCPGVDVYSCDPHDLSLSSEGTSGLTSASSTPGCGIPPHLDPQCAAEIPSNDWYDALANVAQRAVFSIIVCHRESIRNLSGLSVKVPYCCMGMFDYSSSKLRQGKQGNTAGAGASASASASASAKAPPRDDFKFQYLLDNSGHRVI